MGQTIGLSPKGLGSRLGTAQHPRMQHKGYLSQLLLATTSSVNFTKPTKTEAQGGGLPHPTFPTNWRLRPRSPDFWGASFPRPPERALGAQASGTLGPGRPAAHCNQHGPSRTCTKTSKSLNAEIISNPHIADSYQHRAISQRH